MPLLVSWPYESSTAARPMHACPRCGGTVYENLVHLCATAVRTFVDVSKQQGPAKAVSG